MSARGFGDTVDIGGVLLLFGCCACLCCCWWWCCGPCLSAYVTYISTIMQPPTANANKLEELSNQLGNIVSTLISTSLRSNATDSPTITTTFTHHVARLDQMTTSANAIKINTHAPDPSAHNLTDATELNRTGAKSR